MADEQLTGSGARDADSGSANERDAATAAPLGPPVLDAAPANDAASNLPKTDAGRDASPDGGKDSGVSSGDASTRDDGGADASAATPEIDADAGADCPHDFEPNYDACAAALPLQANTPATTQDTADGARGDCAVHASGTGGRNLYYTLTLPHGQYARVVAAPVDPTQTAVLRVLSDCHAAMASDGTRGLSDGRAVLCLRNDTIADRQVIVAVGRYSGEAQDLTLVFDLSVEIIPLAQGCVW